ncbi:MAG: methyltransferase [Planctomycetaceae bacterium]
MHSPDPIAASVPAPTPSSPRDRDNRFYTLVAGGAKTRLLEQFLDLGIPELLGAAGPQPATEICTRLGIDLTRGWKFLHLLALCGLLVERGAERGGDDAVYALSPEAVEYFGPRGDEGWFFRDVVNYWRNVAVLPMGDVLKGLPLPEAVRWPPPGPEAAEHLETWMRVTAEGAIRSLERSDAMAGARRLLDVGGGDGTIGCALAKRHPGLDVTVFNLPASAAIAQRTIGFHGLADRVRTHAGDFLADEFPGGFDRVLFSRVLTDWAPDVCAMLMEKSRRALAPRGRLVINEALVDGNLDYAIAWEFRYVFYDTFGRAVFKPLDVYRRLLADAGFVVVHVTPMSDESFYSVIEAAPA